MRSDDADETVIFGGTPRFVLIGQHVDGTSWRIRVRHDDRKEV